MLDWGKISSAADTLVFFMGARSLQQVVEQLTRHGRSPATPVALIRWGTCPTQEVVTGTLESIRSRAGHMAPPTLIVVGEVVRLRERLRWFDNRPLFGKRILITRPRQQAQDFRRALELLGATAISFPTVEVREPDSWDRLDRAIETIDRYDWLIFTSVNGVKYFFQRYFRHHSDIRQLKGVRIAAIGPATRRAVLDFSLAVDTLPSDYQAEGLVESLRARWSRACGCCCREPGLPGRCCPGNCNAREPASRWSRPIEPDLRTTFNPDGWKSWEKLGPTWWSLPVLRPLPTWPTLSVPSPWPTACKALP